MKRRRVAALVGSSVKIGMCALNGRAEISPKMKAKILEAAAKLGYRPNKLARGLRSNKTEVIGVIVGDISQFFLLCRGSGEGKKAKSLGYSLILQDTGEDYKNEEKDNAV